MNARTFDNLELPSRCVVAERTHVPGESDCQCHDGRAQTVRALSDGPRHEDGPTIAGKAVKHDLESVNFNVDHEVASAVSYPILPVGGVAGLKDSLASKGAIVEVAGMKTLQFKGISRCFDCEEDAFAVAEADRVRDGVVNFVPNDAPKRGADAPANLSSAAVHVELGAAIDRTIASGTDDAISIDADSGALDLERPADERAQRRRARTAPAHAGGHDVLRKYADQIGPAIKGAVTHAGGKAEVVC